MSYEVITTKTKFPKENFCVEAQKYQYEMLKAELFLKDHVELWNEKNEEIYEKRDVSKGCKDATAAQVDCRVLKDFFNYDCGKGSKSYHCTDMTPEFMVLVPCDSYTDFLSKNEQARIQRNEKYL